GGPASVGVVGSVPPFTEHVRRRAGDRLVALTPTHIGRIDDIIENEMPIVERVPASGELDCPAAILLEEFGGRGRNPFRAGRERLHAFILWQGDGRQLRHSGLGFSGATPKPAGSRCRSPAGSNVVGFGRPDAAECGFLPT